VCILAAGRGARLGNLTAAHPKPLVAVHDRELLQWVLEIVWTQAEWVPTVVVHGYLGHQIVHMLDSRGWTARGIGAVAAPLIDTGVSLEVGVRALRRMDRAISTVISVNADTLVIVPLRELVRQHLKTAAACTVAVTSRKDAQNPGSIRVSRNRIVWTNARRGFVDSRKGPALTRAAAVDSCGVIAWSITPSLQWIRGNSVVDELIPRCVKEGRAFAYDLGDAPCVDCGTERGLRRADGFDWTTMLAMATTAAN
jgi:CTP:molybdopterin cytidylyltransferase MocA